MESMTTNCQPTGFVGYSVRHNPSPYLSSLGNGAVFDVPYPQLQVDLDADQLPAFSFTEHAAAVPSVASKPLHPGHKPRPRRGIEVSGAARPSGHRLWHLPCTRSPARKIT